MDPIRTVIVDDEPLAREGIRVLLERDPEFEIVAECSDGVAALRSIRADPPDLVFLDVQMPRMNGFEVLGQLADDELPVVIFVTAYDEYAVRAFEHHALDYLLKPFDDERFERTLGRVKQHVRQRDSSRLAERMLALAAQVRGAGPERTPPSARPAPETLQRLAVRSGGRVYFLKAEEIDWIEAADYYVKLHVGDRSHLLRESMNGLERRLDPRRFLRIHRSTIVNLERVKELRAGSDNQTTVLLQNGTQLRLSRNRRERLNALLGR